MMPRVYGFQELSATGRRISSPGLRMIFLQNQKWDPKKIRLRRAPRAQNLYDFEPSPPARKEGSKMPLRRLSVRRLPTVGSDRSRARPTHGRGS
jgi:hypothetical protein